MKYIFITIFFCTSFYCKAQKYVLLDETLTSPVIYESNLTELTKHKKFFPVEVKNISQFIIVLEAIKKRLNDPNNQSPAKNYQVGCAEFTGRVFPLAKGERIDYMITSTCEGIKITMHLCDAKLTNTNNSYFVSTWINYIKNNMKEKK